MALIKVKLVKTLPVNSDSIRNLTWGVSTSGLSDTEHLHEIHTACASRWSNPDEAEVGRGQMTHMRGHHAAHKLVTKLVVRHDPWETERKRCCYENKKAKSLLSWHNMMCIFGTCFFYVKIHHAIWLSHKLYNFLLSIVRRKLIT